ncbi:MAG: ParB/RepB/Spo0J family partition protein, partial [Deltaproteobacteria bacterium]|nr:ParB/RepB/Spo0J family partition protein [Deltaproteobacteria bacterium]
MARQTLGRGLNALLGDDPVPQSQAPTSNGTEIDIDLIDPNPQQPRTRFEETALNELAASIKANGIVQPIVVRPFAGRYQIVAGERRWRASQIAELRRIPAVIKEVSDERLLELALIENIQRQELNPIEEARAYRKLIDTLGLTQETVAERVGKDRTVITTSLRLLRLPDEIQKHIEKGSISAGHGRALLMTDDLSFQNRIVKGIIENGWSVRETERTVKRGHSQSNPVDTKKLNRPVDPNVRAAETKLMRSLNTKVQILPAKKGTGGKIEIEYYGPDDLERLFQQLSGR